jgi:hypothetical protein
VLTQNDDEPGRTGHLRGLRASVPKRSRGFGSLSSNPVAESI